jgi:hypothetical protein
MYGGCYAILLYNFLFLEGDNGSWKRLSEGVALALRGRVGFGLLPYILRLVNVKTTLRPYLLLEVGRAWCGASSLTTS